MNEDIMNFFGFNMEVDLVKQGKCPFCKKVVNIKDFRDNKSKKEFTISGLCQFCQDSFFEGRMESEKGGTSNETRGMGK